MLYIIMAVPGSRISAHKMLLAVLIILTALGTGDARVITVCPHGCDSTAISSAVVAAHTADVLMVQSGTYVENLLINKTIVLRGVNTGDGDPRLDANGKKNGIIVAADGVILEGFNISNSKKGWFDLWAGIEVTSDNNIIANNTLIDNENGILLTGSVNSTVRNNRLLDNKNGIKLDCSYENRIAGNYIQGRRYGILLENSSNNTLNGNEIASCRSGMVLHISEGNHLAENIMHENAFNFGAGGYNDVDTSNLVDSRPILYLVRERDVLVNSSRGVGTVYCIDCINVTLRDLNLEGNLYGMYLSNTTQSIVERSSLVNNSYGLWLDGSDGNIVRENRAEDNKADGIASVRSQSNVIVNNSLLGNGNAGLNLTHCSNSTISGNRASYNQQGLSLLRSIFIIVEDNDLSHNSESGLFIKECSSNLIRENRIDSNNITENSRGISLAETWFNEIEDNIINANGRGIYMQSGRGNRIIGNRITLNKVGLSLDPSGDNILNNIVINNGQGNQTLPPGSVTEPAGPTVSGEFVKVIIDPRPLQANITLDGEPLGDNKEAIYYSTKKNTDLGSHTVDMYRNDNIVYTESFIISKQSPKKIYIPDADR